MRSGELQSSKGVSFRAYFIIVIVGLLVAFLFGWPALKARQNAVEVGKQREWIQKTVRELATKGTPDTNEIQRGIQYWITENYLIFSNGWASYKINTIHTENGVGNVALLRLSDGSYFSNGRHYCTGIEGWLPDYSIERERSPMDAQEYFEKCSMTNEWNLLSPDGRILCAVFCPDADRENQHKKTMWVSVYSSDNETNMFERKYVFTGKFLTWKTRWSSNENISVEVFNRDWRPFYYPNTPPASLATLKFHRANTGSPFVEVKD